MYLAVTGIPKIENLEGGARRAARALLTIFRLPEFTMFHPYPNDMKAQVLLRKFGLELQPFSPCFLGIHRATFGTPDLVDLLCAALRIPALPGFVGEKPVAPDRSWHAAQGRKTAGGV